MNNDVLRYVENEMSDVERANFAEKLQSDRVLRDEYDTLVAAKKLSNQWIDLEIKSYLEKMSNKKQKAPTKRYILFAVITLLLITLGAYLFFINNNQAKEDLATGIKYAANFDPPVWPIERGGTNSLSQAISFHLTGKTNEAITLLLAKGEDTSEETYYWVSEILISAGRCDEARAYFDNIITMTAYQDRIAYLKSHCNY